MEQHDSSHARRTGTLYWLPIILDAEHLDPTETLLLLALADHVNADDECYVGIKRLAARARVSYGTARRRLAALEDRGVITRTRLYRDSGAESVYAYSLVRAALDQTEGRAQIARGPAQIERGPRAPGRAGGPAHQGARAEPPRKEPPQEPTPTRDGLFDLDEQSEPAEDVTAEPLAAGFDRFWEAYPRRTAKGAARRAWPAAVRAAGSIEKILAGARRYRDDPNRDEQFTAHPATWLRAERWDDPPLPARTGSPANAARVDRDRSAPTGRITL